MSEFVRADGKLKAQVVAKLRRENTNMVSLLMSDVIHTAGRVYKTVSNDAHARP